MIYHNCILGIGPATSISKIVVWWQKTGKKQEFVDIPIDSKILIVEGKDTFETLSEPSFVVDSSVLGQAAHEPHTCH
jgi:hypothetical protein